MNRVVRLGRCFLAGAAMLGAGTTGASAAIVPPLHLVRGDARPLQQRRVQTLAPASLTTWRPTRPGTHVFFGTIAAVTGARLQIRLRNGRLQPVDATAAIAAGNYSAPLFVGKPVSVDGETVAGRFTATHIFRIGTLANLRADR